MTGVDEVPDWATPDQRHERGRVARKAVPRSSHAEWVPPADRGDPVAVITDQDADRLQWLVPIRHGRMAESSFAFYRGSAAIMAADLASTPESGLDAQLCGDAHLSNFGGFASAERTQVFDVNDFDDTLPGPWEWDVKRLATSFVLAGRENGFDRDDKSHYLRDDRGVLLDRYRLLDMAMKVVGVGTRCLLVLLKGRDEHDPLLLQIKEAGPSVLESHLAPSSYEDPGERVVTGQRLIQASSDVFLGWSHGPAGRHFYWRQFHDMKGSADYATMNPRRLGLYATMCGWTLAHAHARSGDPIAISGYLGTGDSFDKAITRFAFAYADQNDSDYKAISDAIDSGRITAEKD